MSIFTHSIGRRAPFDYVPDGLNDYEKSVALYLDKHPEVLWWSKSRWCAVLLNPGEMI